MKESLMGIRRTLRLIVALTLASVVVAPARSTRAATLCVNPGGTGGCFSSIQAAIDGAAARDVVSIAAGTYAEQVVIGPPRRLRLEGAGAGATVIQPAAGPALRVAARTRAEIAGLTLQGGAALDEKGSAAFSDSAFAGGMIFAGARTVLSLTDCVSTGASVHAVGSRLGLLRTVISDSPTSGIYARAKLDMVDSTVRDSASFGIEVSGGRIRGSTVSGSDVFGVDVGSNGTGGGTLRVERSTIHGNGGGVLVDEHFAVIVEQSTIAGNGAVGLAVSPAGYRAPGRLSLHASIVAGHSSHDCVGAVRSTGGNVVQDPTGCGLVGPPPVTGDPLLGPLADNGGATETRALLAGSPALGIIGDGSCRNPDQRGVARSVPCDAGAYEAP